MEPSNETLRPPPHAFCPVTLTRYNTCVRSRCIYFGQRVGKTDSTGTLSYKLADDAIDSNVLSDGQATYQYGMGLVSEVRGGTSRVYHADSLGTTRAMSGSSGTASANLETDAFGQTVSVGGTFTPFGFAGGHGYQSDPDSGLMKLGHRYYDASIGRFLSRDPSRAGKNWYTYCQNNPINSIDPTGYVGEEYIGPAEDLMAEAFEQMETAIETEGPILEQELAEGWEKSQETLRAIAKEQTDNFTRYVRNITPFNDAAKTAAKYGGAASDWAKKSAQTFLHPTTDAPSQIHWVEKTAEGLKILFKVKTL